MKKTYSKQTCAVAFPSLKRGVHDQESNGRFNVPKNGSCGALTFRYALPLSHVYVYIHISSYVHTFFPEAEIAATTPPGISAFGLGMISGCEALWTFPDIVDLT